MSTKECEAEYGDAVATSNSGQIFLFRSSLKCKFGYTIARFTFDGFVPIKRFDLIQVLERLLLDKHQQEKIFETFRKDSEVEMSKLIDHINDNSIKDVS